MVALGEPKSAQWSNGEQEGTWLEDFLFQLAQAPFHYAAAGTLLPDPGAQPLFSVSDPPHLTVPELISSDK